MRDEDFQGINLNNPVPSAEAGRSLSGKRRPQKNWLTRIFVGLLLLLAVAAGVIWWLLLPANQDPANLAIKPGASLSQVIDQLAENGVVRQPQLAKLYLKITKANPKLVAGDYQIAPKQSSLLALLANLHPTTPNTKKLTFYPGATLNHNNSKTDETPSHRQALKKVGYNDAQIDQAFSEYRSHLLFKLLPEVDNLEGLIYGETYEIFAKGSVEDALKRTFDEYLKVIKNNNLVEAYQKQGLTLYQGIILASIVEREVHSSADRAQVAQVFLKRYRDKMMLGSDVTYQYASRLAGKENDLFIKSPFNTRQVVGLPPTPIASPSQSSLLAVAQPANTDYLYFVSGDDDKTYFAKTLAEHERNVKQHCHKKCAVH